MKGNSNTVLMDRKYACLMKKTQSLTRKCSACTVLLYLLYYLSLNCLFICVIIACLFICVIIASRTFCHLANLAIYNTTCMYFDSFSL